jgi:shikimate dehydrogenase
MPELRLFGLIGYPLSHSFSKEYFTKKFEKEGIKNCSYELFPIQSILELRTLVRETPALEGLNVTIPYKKEVLPLLDSTDQIPAGLEACNCIRIKDDKLQGFNTDITGFEKSIRPLLKLHHSKGLVLGNGGATAAVTYVLNRLGVDFHIVSREIHDGSTLTYRDLNKDNISNSKLIINTTPLGMYPDAETFPPIPYQYIGADHLVFDLVYNPVKTVFLAKCEAQGATIKNGEEMLAEQAEESWRIWNQ